MKLIVTGGSGYVANEVIRQSLLHPKITSVVAVSRTPVTAPEGLAANVNKLKSVVVKDYTEYDASARKEFEGAAACIWTVAVTPTKSKDYAWEDIVKISHDSTLAGLKAITTSRGSASSVPLKFMYMSGQYAERDQSKVPTMMPELLLMRGRVENDVLSFAADPANNIEACVAKPGLIKKAGGTASKVFVDDKFPSVKLEEVAAAMISQVINGFEKDPLLNDDLVRFGRAALAEH